ncbi:uncharacterized protein KY384_008676 [Bacidia gigantensis]|uniref:uncharacterized protein n=1 Tax=Bacidia gigantensis TaxID=2732470 RepID=UPI001D0484F8|nr:uncharacterized protein KY384_008676 [Bacidia gigantensis]KAG8526476.1 hypothetical protein KY384_008676 [Bacidia gigantensis]
MSVPTRVLENGQWITRWVDPYQLLSQNRVQHAGNTKPAVTTEAAPCKAILTQTLVQSPILKSIHSARIRHRSRNDIVYITENAVHIKEAYAVKVKEEHAVQFQAAQWKYYLESVKVKNDFDSGIRTSAVFGLSKRSSKPLLNPLDIHNDPLGTQLPSNMRIRTTEEKYSDQMLEDDILDPSSDEAETGIVITKDSQAVPEVPSCCDSRHPRHHILPPQVLVLILENAKIVFLYAISGPSRVIAVGAHEGVFRVYTLKSRDILRKELQSSPFLRPIESERSFTVDGIILNMEFLHPTKSDEEHAILLLVVSRDGRSRLMWYEWNIKIALRDAQINPSTYALAAENRLPVLLIPLLSFNAFAIVGESCITIYKDLLKGIPDVFSHRLALPDETKEVQDLPHSRNHPLWVQWARPMRSPTEKAGENIYLCREDGVVHYIEFKCNRQSMLESSHNAGKLGTTVNTSFAVIDFGLNTDDLIVAGSDSSAEGVWRFPARQTVEDLSTLTGWISLNDCTSTLVRQEPFQRSVADVVCPNARSCSRLYASTGRAQGGCVSELNHGLQAARSVDLIDLKGVIDTTSLEVFILCALKEATLALISHPASSSLLLITDGADPELLQDLKGFILDSKTIVVKSISEGVVCQVTSRSISIFDIQSATKVDIQWKHTFEGLDEEIIAACVEGNSRLCYLAIALRQGEDFILVVFFSDMTHEMHSTHLELSARPTCLAMLDTGDSRILFIANDQGGLQAIRGSSNGSVLNLCKLGEWHFKGLFEVCDTIVSVKSNRGKQASVFIFCGLRNGQIHILDLEHSTGQFQPLEQIFLGLTSVSVKANMSSPATVIAHCGESLYTVGWSAWSNSISPTEVKRIIVDRTSSPSSEKRDVLAFAHADALPEWQHSMQGTVAALGSNMLQFLILVNGEVSVVSKQWRLNGTPRTCMFSRRLGKIIALSAETTIVRQMRAMAPRRHAGRRTSRPVVSFIDVNENNTKKKLGSEDPDAMQLDEETPTEGTCPCQIIGSRPGEVFLGMTEWFPRVAENEYHLLVFNTMIMFRHRAPAGRLVLCAVTEGDNPAPKLAAKVSFSTTSPVYAAIPHQNATSIIYTTGIELVVIKLDASPNGIRFEEECKIALRSPGRRITMVEPYIYVSTAENSLQVYLYQNCQLSHWQGDAIARPGIFHVTLPKKGVILTSDRNGKVHGLWQPSVRRADNTLATIFEAFLPRTITRLIPIQCPSHVETMLLPNGSILLQSGSPDNAMNDASLSSLLPHGAIADTRSDAVIGISVDGTLTQLLVIDKGWRLLKFIQSLAYESTIICPFKTAGHQNDEASAKNSQSMHINGDILKRLLCRGADALLLAMLDEPTQPEGDHHTENVTAQEKWDHFKKLAAEVLSDEVCKSGSKDKLVGALCSLRMPPPNRMLDDLISSRPSPRNPGNSVYFSFFFGLKWSSQSALAFWSINTGSLP